MCGVVHWDLDVLLDIPEAKNLKEFGSGHQRAKITLPVFHIDVFYGALSHMKTTVEIPDSLLEQTKPLAMRERTTARALAEKGLRLIVAGHKRTKAFKLRKASLRGKGWCPNCVLINQASSISKRSFSQP
jgi:hypothetical protein